MVEYAMESRTKSGQFLARLPFRDLQAEFYYSKTREMRFTMALDSLNELTTEDIYPARTEIVLWRDGVKIFCGPLWDLNISSGERTVKLIAADLSSYFEKRAMQDKETLTGTYGNIAWNLISESQARVNGGLGITRGTAVPSNAPSGSYTVKKGQYLNDALEEIYDGNNGFDWVITADRVYHQFYPRLNSRAPVRLEYGGNIQSYSDTIQGKYIGNHVRTIGKDGIISSPAVDTVSQAEYGLMDYVGEQTGLFNINLLNAHNAQSLDDRRVPRRAPSITLNSTLINPFDGDINYGQMATVVIDDGYTQYNKDMLCRGFQLNFGKSGNESFTLYMEGSGEE